MFNTFRLSLLALALFVFYMTNVADFEGVDKYRRGASVEDPSTKLHVALWDTANFNQKTLDFLNENDANSIFFVSAESVRAAVANQEAYGMVKKAIQEGHQVGLLIDDPVLLFSNKQCGLANNNTPCFSETEMKNLETAFKRDIESVQKYFDVTVTMYYHPRNVYEGRMVVPNKDFFEFSSNPSIKTYKAVPAFRRDHLSAISAGTGYFIQYAGLFDNIATMNSECDIQDETKKKECSKLLAPRNQKNRMDVVPETLENLKMSLDIHRYFFERPKRVKKPLSKLSAASQLVLSGNVLVFGLIAVLFML